MKRRNYLYIAETLRRAWVTAEGDPALQHRIEISHGKIEEIVGQLCSWASYPWAALHGWEHDE